MKEDKFIKLIKDHLPESASYIGDDTAYIQEKDLILTQDTLIEDVHFRKSTISPYDLGIKSIAVNLSDIAASGGLPGWALISLSLPEHIDENFIESFYKGVRDICNKYNTLVIGGDLTRADKITISIALIGTGNGITPAKRSNAVIDDLVVVTGEFGSSRAGLWILESGLIDKKLTRQIPEDIADKFIKAHTNPIPLVEKGREIVASCTTQPALMDSSDGLADALYKISLQSNVSMEIEYSNIPYNKDLKLITDLADTSIFNWVFFGGEDYQLVGAISKECYEKLKSKNIPLIVIGKVIPSGNNPCVYVKLDNKTIEINSQCIDAKGFSHFK